MIGFKKKKVLSTGGASCSAFEELRKNDKTLTLTGVSPALE